MASSYWTGMGWSLPTPQKEACWLNDLLWVIELVLRHVLAFFRPLWNRVKVFLAQMGFIFYMQFRMCIFELRAVMLYVVFEG